MTFNDQFRLVRLVSLLAALMILLSCSSDAGLSIQAGNPPNFLLSGSSRLETVTISGPDTQREVGRQVHAGDAIPHTTVYWQIAPQGETADLMLSRITPITYGVVPEGFSQIFPTNGVPPSLVEGSKYNVRVVARGGHGLNMFFVIKGGKVFTEAD